MECVYFVFFFFAFWTVLDIILEVLQCFLSLVHFPVGYYLWNIGHVTTENSNSMLQSENLRLLLLPSSLMDVTYFDYVISLKNEQIWHWVLTLYWEVVDFFFFRYCGTYRMFCGTCSVQNPQCSPLLNGLIPIRWLVVKVPMTAFPLFLSLLSSQYPVSWGWPT